ncbi:MAG: hypothetical protein AAB486_00620 [Patescibacteria group bacterium]
MAEFTNINKQPPVSANTTPVGNGSVEAAMRSAQALVDKTPAKKNYLSYIVLALALIAVAGGLYWFNLKNTTPVPVAVETTPAVTTQPTVTPTPTPSSVTVQDLQNEADGISISTDSADLTDLNKDIQGL